MSIRKTIVALALVGAALPAAFANSGTTPPCQTSCRSHDCG